MLMNLDTELNTTFDVDDTSCPIEIVWSILLPPLNSTPSLESVTQYQH